MQIIILLLIIIIIIIIITIVSIIKKKELCTLHYNTVLSLPWWPLACPSWALRCWLVRAEAGAAAWTPIIVVHIVQYSSSSSSSSTQY